jgi:hypothetical protein
VPGEIQSTEDYLAVAGGLGIVKQYAAAVEEFIRPMKRAARAAHQKVLEQEKLLLRPARQAEAAWKDMLIEYEEHQRRIRREQELLLLEEQRGRRRSDSRRPQSWRPRGALRRRRRS